MQNSVVFNKMLADYREERNFNAKKYVQEKIKLINRWFSKNHLENVVVGVSGGVDSAVVYYILQRAALHSKTGGLKRVIPVHVPISKSIGTTGQDLAYANAMIMNVISKVSDKIHVVEAGGVSNMLADEIGDSIEVDAFTKGQMDYYLRPMIFYTFAAKHKAVVCGTINRDEGSFIGYFGKKTDTCDIQIISDLHKSEVYAVAKYLGVPDEIINAAPSGGLYSGNTDEQEIGASYDMIELYTGYIVARNLHKMAMSYNFNDGENYMIDCINDKNRQNAHKYIRKLDCTFIDSENYNRVLQSQFSYGGFDPGTGWV